MKFRLVYEGEVPSTQKLNPEEETELKITRKHQIRKIFHAQIKKLLESSRVPDFVKNAEPAELNFETEFDFVPMVWENKSPSCSLDFLFLRRDIPGEKLYAGDIDNRVKTLMDALRVPRSRCELRNQRLDKREAPFYCLLEDDSLVSHLSIEMDPAA